MAWTENLNEYLTPRRRLALLLCLVVVYAFFLTYKINGPLFGTNDVLPAAWGIAAWNWLLHGPLAMKFGVMTTIQLAWQSEITKGFFPDHPSFFIAPTALAYRLFGVGEWQTRLAPIIFSLLAFITFWAFISLVFKKPWLTATSSIFYVFFPMGIFYGRLLEPEPFILFFILALILAVTLFEERKQNKYLVAIFFAVFFGGLMDWTFFLAAGAIWWYVALKTNYPQRKTVLFLLIAASVASIAITFIQFWAITGSSPLPFYKSLFLERQSKYFGPSTILLFLLMRANFDSLGFSEVGLFLALVGLLYYFSVYFRDKDKMLLPLLLAGPAVLIFAVFRNNATAHQFYGLFFLPFIAFMSGYGMGYFQKKFVIAALLVMFIFSSLWYSLNLFRHQSFMPDDYTLVKRVNAALPQPERVCFGDFSVAGGGLLAMKFYLYPRQIDYTPCSNDAYFFFRQPQSWLKGKTPDSLLQTMMSNGIGENIKQVSLSASLGIEAIRRLGLGEKIESMMWGGLHSGYSYYAKTNQDTIDRYGLKPIDCSTNFCLYVKK